MTTNTKPRSSLQLERDQRRRDLNVWAGLPPETPTFPMRDSGERREWLATRKLRRWAP